MELGAENLTFAFHQKTHEQAQLKRSACLLKKELKRAANKKKLSFPIKAGGIHLPLLFTHISQCDTSVVIDMSLSSQTPRPPVRFMLHGSFLTELR